MKSKNKSNKGLLVKGYIPPISRRFLEFSMFRKEIGEMLKGNAGVYVLYKDHGRGMEELYYIGITKDLFWRLHSHTRDKHKSNWNKFGAFIIGRGAYLKDIESMINLISNTRGNVAKGRFKEHYQYDRRIKGMIKEAYKSIKEIEMTS